MPTLIVEGCFALQTKGSPRISRPRVLSCADPYLVSWPQPFYYIIVYYIVLYYIMLLYHIIILHDSTLDYIMFHQPVLAQAHGDVVHRHVGVRGGLYLCVCMYIHIYIYIYTHRHIYIYILCRIRNSIYYSTSYSILYVIYNNHNRRPGAARGPGSSTWGGRRRAQSRAEQSRVEYSRIEQRIEQNRAEQSRIEQNRVEQSRIEQNRVGERSRVFDLGRSCCKIAQRQDDRCNSCSLKNPS